MNSLVELIIWILIVFFIVLILTNYGVRYSTGFSLGFIIAAIILYALQTHKYDDVFIFSVLVAVIFGIIYIIMNSAQEVSYNRSKVYF